MENNKKNASLLYHKLHLIQDAFLNFWSGTEDLIQKAIEIEMFLITLFDLNISHENNYLELLKFKRRFIQRYALKKYPNPLPVENPIQGDDFIFMRTVEQWEKEGKQELVDQAAQHVAFLHQQEPLNLSFLFKNPHPKGLRHLQKDEHFLFLPKEQQIHRHDFSLSDQGLSEAEAQDQAFYCIKCHKQNKDSCSTGIKDLPGCPLDQKISEMNILKEMGYNIAALAVITLDNPMVALTGHRICNDCRAACIFQKQDPVDIPGIETQILKTVLSYPFGFEIYSLLTKWNPLGTYIQNTSDKNILIAGMGPAGIALSHYLLNSGHKVVGIDGLKMEKWPSYLTMRDKDKKAIFPLIENIQNVYDLPHLGFGGVCSYGITARWDKRLLNVVRLILERHVNFHLKDSVRLGSQISFEQTKIFDHVALCLGAGSPQILDIPNILAPGVYMASDFLMSLHIGEKINIKPPVVVIGGGLTAIDACCEAKVYTQTNSATLVYRKAFDEAPSYRLNLEEVQKALQEGIHILEEANPLRIEIDEKGFAKGLWVKHEEKELCLEARTILIAIGTIPNRAHDLPEIKDLENGFFSHGMSILGDMNPHYSGSVVKAIKSAKDAAVLIEKKLKSRC